MSAIIILTLLICLGLIVVQDVRYREIHIILPLIIFFISLLNLYQQHYLDYRIPLLNIGFFLLIFVVLVSYMSLKSRMFLNPFSNYFGLGDLLYFIAIAPLFIVYNYVMFFICSMLFSIVLYLLFKKWMRHSTIPLAGLSALLLMLFIIKDVLFDFQRFTLTC